MQRHSLYSRVKCSIKELELWAFNIDLVAILYIISFTKCLVFPSLHPCLVISSFCSSLLAALNASLTFSPYAAVLYSLLVDPLTASDSNCSFGYPLLKGLMCAEEHCPDVSNLDDAYSVGHIQSIVVCCEPHVCLLAAIRPDKGVDLLCVDIIQLVDCCLNLALGRPNIHDEDLHAMQSMSESCLKMAALDSSVGPCHELPDLCL